MSIDRLGHRQRRFLDGKLADVVATQPRFAALAGRLMAVGGLHVVATHEKHLEELLTRGSVRTGLVEDVRQVPW